MLFFDDIRVLIIGVCLLALAGLLLVLLALDAIRHLSSGLSRGGLVVFVLAAAIATVEAQKRGPMRVPQHNDGGMVSSANDDSAQTPTIWQDDRPFRLTSYSISNGTNCIGVAWNRGSLPMGVIEGAVTDGLTNGWRYYGSWQASSSQTNMEIRVVPSELGLNVASGAFVMVAPAHDTDGDGLTDFQELYSHGTSPFTADTDGDGYPDGFELARHVEGLNPTCSNDWGTISHLRVSSSSSLRDVLAAAGPYDVIELQPGTYDVGSWNWLPTNAVLLSSAGGGFDGHVVLRSSVDGPMFVTPTNGANGCVFQGMVLDMVARNGFQVGFWVGANLPWAGIGKHATFRNLYVRMPNVGVKYHGLLFYGPSSVPSYVENCVFNMSGADDARAVFGMDGANVSMSDCKFVGFSSNVSDEQTGAILMGETTLSPSGSSLSTNNCVIVSSLGEVVDGSFTADTDGDGLSDGRELQLGCDPFCVDTDGDHVEDGMEATHGSDPADRDSYCFSPVFIISNLTDRVSLIKAAFGDVVLPLTNECNVIDGGHVRVEGGANPELFVFVDVNTNGICESNERLESFSFSVARHSFTNHYQLTPMSMDRDRDGIPDWWETVHGLSCTNKNDAVLDCDEDGLINLHEYWAGTDPFTPDGSNTLLSVCSRSIDDRIKGIDLTNSLSRFENYFINGSNNIFVVNTNLWTKDLDLSCVSVWNTGDHPETKYAVAITRRHVIMSAHWRERVYSFCDKNGNVMVRAVQDERHVDSDMILGRLGEPLPSTCRFPKILPLDYQDYIFSGKHLPALCINHDNAVTALEIEFLSGSVNTYTRYCGLSLDNVVSAERHDLRACIASGYSSCPVFLVADDDLIFLMSKHLGTRNVPIWSRTYGPYITPRLSAIQTYINQWEGSDAANYQIEIFELNQYEPLQQH